MYKRLCILASFVLVLAFVGVANAEWLDVNNYSFELMADGNQVTCHAAIDISPDLGVLGWDSNWPPGASNAYWAGVDPNCSAPNVAPGECCRDWHRFPDGDVVCYIDDPLWVYQVLDYNITVGKRYDLLFDGMIWTGAEHDIIRTHFYYPADATPDPNQIDVSVKDNVVVCENTPEGLQDWVYDIKHTFIAKAGQPYVGKKLGIKFTAPAGGSWVWIDNVRVWSQWASQAYDPKPADGAIDVSKNAILKWTPGLWAKPKGGHDVYLGNTWADVNSATTATSGIFKGNQDANNYDPCTTGTLVLGKTYYWRIDEVNQNYTSPPGPIPAPPDGKWKGDIWSFIVEGRARNPYPADGANDVPKNVVLKWMAGADCKYHDVYFGTSESAVEAATTATSGIYKTRINRTTEEWQEYDPVAANPQVGTWYFWRIDEVNTMTVKGYVWNFKVANWILVDDFDFYANASVLNTKWKAVNADTAYLLVNKEPNFTVEESNSMQFEYTNDGTPWIAEAKRTYSPVQNWSYTGNSVTLLELNFFGDANNQETWGSPAKTWTLDPPMYVKLSDGTKTAQVNYPDPNDFIEEWQHTWNIPLSNFSAKGVTLSKISSIVLGMGDKSGEPDYQKGTMYFDDIKLLPPTCVTEYGPAADLTDDCTVDNADLDIMATDWLLTDGMVATETQPAELTNFANDPCQWITGHINGALEADGNNDKINVYNSALTGLTSMTISLWVNRYGTQDGYDGIVTSREGENICTELTFGVSGETIGYAWNSIAKTWMWDSGLSVPDATWTFVAMDVDPTGCTLYARPAGGSLSSARHVVSLPPLEVFNDLFWIGRGYEDDRFCISAFDDLRIYDYNLSSTQISNLSGGISDPNPWPVYWYKFDEANGFTAHDSGYGADVYCNVLSKANLTDPEPQLQRSVNFRDYALLADEWLTEKLWPLP